MSNPLFSDEGQHVPLPMQQDVPKVINHHGRASAIYYPESKRIQLVAEDFDDAQKALMGLEIRVKALNKRAGGEYRTD